MNITDIQRCARYYQKNYLETFYIVSTYHGKSFILIGEKENFPHLMGISKSTYRSNGYRSPNTLYRDIIGGHDYFPNKGNYYQNNYFPVLTKSSIRKVSKI